MHESLGVIAESETEVLQPQAFIKQFLETEILEFILVFHLDFYYFLLADVFVPNIVFRQVDMCD